MPITTSGTITHLLEDVHVHQGGAVSVTVRTKFTGFSDIVRTFEIPQVDALPFWAAIPPLDKSRWDDLCNVLYQFLLDRGDLAGDLS